MRISLKLRNLLIAFLMLVPVVVVLMLLLYPKSSYSGVYIKAPAVVNGSVKPVPTWSELHSSVYSKVANCSPHHIPGYTPHCHPLISRMTLNRTASAAVSATSSTPICPFSCTNIGGCRC